MVPAPAASAATALAAAEWDGQQGGATVAEACATAAARAGSPLEVVSVADVQNACCKGGEVHLDKLAAFLSAAGCNRALVVSFGGPRPWFFSDGRVSRVRGGRKGGEVTGLEVRWNDGPRAIVERDVLRTMRYAGQAGGSADAWAVVQGRA